MQVGDLVTKVTAWEGRVYGIIIAMEHHRSELNVEVQWAGYGTFWDSVDRVEPVDASR